jgi:hypothetical protein
MFDIPLTEATDPIDVMMCFRRWSVKGYDMNELWKKRLEGFPVNVIN